jgi:site-specific DNA-methyltransferase (adenine-specific)
MIKKSEWKNKLYFGDNLQILREQVAEESVDLIYLDPPFNSQATYNVLFGEKNGSQSQAQIAAFDDTWHWSQEAEATYHEILINGPQKLAELVEALRSFLGQNDMMAYLTMMAIRLAELHRVLRPSGSIFLHCDPTASHYLKLLMDAAFDPRNFRNELIWCRTSPKSHMSKRFPSGHDVILFYGKSATSNFNVVHMPHDKYYVESHYSSIEPETGRRYMLDNLINPNVNRPNLTYEFPPGSGTIKVWRWTRERMMKAWEEGRVVIPKPGGIARQKRFLDEQPGTSCTTVWNDIPPINSQAKERLGYPTQKPEALIERIINAGSREGELVLDPFCGCGTTINVAERLHRRWIGIDITHLAIALIRNRLHDTFGPELSPYEVVGAPRDLSSARALAQHDRYQFEWWALSLVNARPAQDKKKGADSGVDGYIYFFDDGSGKAKKIVVQVKSGHVTVSQIRDLKAVVDREKAVIGVFISLEPASKPMKQEALAAGYYAPQHLAKEHTAPKIQIVTIAELLNGFEIQYPRMLVTTFKKAERKYKDVGPKQDELL